MKELRCCSVEGCDRKHQAKGLCSYHYRFPDRTPTQTHTGGICGIPDCTNKLYARALCVKHYSEHLRNGGRFPGTRTDRRRLLSSEYRIWTNIKYRCFNPNCDAYDRYGGRGITVCDKWRNDFEAFLRDMGPRPYGTSVERINNDGDYEPSNCKWATPKEQANNRRQPRRRRKNQ